MLNKPALPASVDAWAMTTKAERKRLRGRPDQVQLELFGLAPISDTACLWVKCVAEAVNITLVSCAHRNGLYQAPIPSEGLNKHLQQHSYPEPTDVLMLVLPSAWSLLLNTLESEKPRPRAVSDQEHDLIRAAIIQFSQYAALMQRQSVKVTLAERIRLAKPLNDHALRSRFQQPPERVSRHFGEAAAQQLLCTVRAEWLMRLSNPFCKIDLAEETTCVEFMNLIRFIRDGSERELSEHFTDGSGRWHKSETGVDLYRPIKSYWLTFFLAEWIERNQPALPLEIYLALHNWLKKCLQRESKRLNLRVELSRAALRAFTGAELLNEEVRRLAMLGQTADRDHVLHSGAYNQTWEGVENLRRIKLETPNLLELFLLGIHQQEIDTFAGVDELKLIMRSHGLTRSGWLLLCRHGSEMYFGLKRTQALKLNLQNIAKHVSFFAAVDSHRCPPRGLQKALYLTDVLESDEINQLPVQFVRLAWRRFEDHQAKDSAVFFIKEEFLPVLWWLRADKPHLDKNQRRAGWRFWLNAYNQWVQTQSRPEQNVRWETASRLKPFECGRHIALPLSKAIALIEEAEAMHNCLAEFIEDCANGLYLAFSIRDRATWKNVATLGLEFKDGLWIIDQVQGFANRPVGYILRRAANEICSSVNASLDSI